jgi:hypothetical protein
VNLDEMLYGGGDIEGDFVAIFFNLIVSTIPKWWMPKLLMWVHLLNKWVDFDAILYIDDGIEGDLDAIFLIP